MVGREASGGVRETSMSKPAQSFLTIVELTRHLGRKRVRRER